MTCNSDPGGDSSDQSIEIRRNGSDPVGSNDQSTNGRPSIGRRRLHSVAHFFITALIAILIGVAASSAWQSHGNEAKELARTWGRSLDWLSPELTFRGHEAKKIVSAWVSSLGRLFPVSTTKSPPGVEIVGKPTGSTHAGQVFTQDAASPQSAPVNQKRALVAVAISPELVQQLKTMARGVTVMRQKVEQLAAMQEEMTSNIASLHAAEQEIKQKVPSPPLSSTAPPPPTIAPRIASPPAQTQPAQMQFAPQDIEPQASPGGEQEENALLPPRLQRQIVTYRTKEARGTLVVDTPNTFLYFVLGHGKAIRYGIGVGREGFTWSGVRSITRKQEWPDWYPPKEMIVRQPYLPRMVAGGLGNPLGARALYIGGTAYRIHGTNNPSSIGKFMSSGCIRLTNNDVLDLYNRVKIGAKVIVLPMSRTLSVHQ
jgi:lipoprotein-anchoring transpeptidase ErfK/SrfK